MKLTLQATLSLCLLSLISCTHESEPVRLVREDSANLAKYIELTTKIGEVGAERTDLMQKWDKACKAWPTPHTLDVNKQTILLGCQPTPPAVPPAPAASTPAAGAPIAPVPAPAQPAAGASTPPAAAPPKK